MKKLLTLLALAALVCGTTVVGQESIPPVQVGGGQSTTRVLNGQTVEVSSTLPATIYFTEVSTLRVTGVASRGCGGTCEGSVKIRWVDRVRETTVWLGPWNPDVPFGMENGDVDKRTDPPTRD